MPNLIKRIWSFARTLAQLVGLIASPAFAVIAPIVLTGAVAIMGWFDFVQRQTPLSIVTTMVIVSFAAACHGALRFDDWRQRRRVEGKLLCSQILVGTDIRSGDITFGVSVTHSASFPIEIELTEFRSQLGTTVPEKPHSVQRFTINPSTFLQHTSNGIKIAPRPKGVILSGFADVTIKYGRPGSDLPYIFDIKRQIIIHFSDDGAMLQNVEHMRTTGN